MSSAIVLPRRVSLARAWPLVVVLALAPLWLVGTLYRGAWTPDEPREADIVARMSTQSDRSLPNFAGTPFLEKPPLSYWIAAGSQSVFGDSIAAARVPNLLYAAVTALAIGAIAFAMSGTYAAIIAALVACSALTVLRVAIWLAPDAALLAGCSIALLGAYLGYVSRPGKNKLIAYTLMHAGAAIGFMAKSAPGWLVPALALGTLIVWERRWSELRRWELYAGLLLQALIIGPWLLTVARGSDGAHALHVLFWDNVTGRFTSVASSTGLDYTTGHRNSPFRYFRQLPLSLLPWTVIVIAALRAAWHRVRAKDTAGTAWRFAVSAMLPFLALLSVAATARDIYAAPIILGAGLLVALWATELRGPLSRLDQFALRATRGIVLFMGVLFAAGLCLFAAAGTMDASGWLYLAAAVVIASVIALTRYAARLDRNGDRIRGLMASYAAFAVALTLTGFAVFPSIDRWQDLGWIGERVHFDTVDNDLALLQPDETTMAFLDHPLRTRFVALDDKQKAPEEVVAEWFREHDGRARVLVKLPGRAPGELTTLIERWHRLKRPGDGVAHQLENSGVARIVALYELPHGRRYALLGPANETGPSTQTR
jgi:4-amino-4-deoxy-L-arabinose transferase-like glycosyltransferase